MRLSAAALLALTPVLLAAPAINKAKAFGNPEAPITIELFSDFQCPSCRALHMDVLPALIRDYVVPGKAYLVFREFPLPGHNHSREAAAYACAAARVGKYEQVADVLFRNQPSWSNDGKVFETVAAALTPAEQKRVQALARDPAVLSEVDQEVQEGQAERVNATPTLLIIHGSKKTPVSGLNYNLLRLYLDGLTK
jgi:protein-disulfide isomerase